MRMFSLLGRAAVRSPFVFGSTARAALPHFNVLPLVVAAGVISVLAQPPEAAECMGKRKKKDSVLEDDMYEVDYIKARKLEKGKPFYLIRWKGFDDDKYDTWEPLENLSGFGAGAVCAGDKAPRGHQVRHHLTNATVHVPTHRGVGRWHALHALEARWPAVVACDAARAGECARRSSCWYQPVYAGQCLGW